MAGRKLFKQGESGNPNGRPKGAKDKKTEQWNKLGEFIINKGAKKYMDYIDGLKDKDYAERFERILEYFKPKQQRTEIKGEITTGPKKIGFEE